MDKNYLWTKVKMKRIKKIYKMTKEFRENVMWRFSPFCVGWGRLFGGRK